MSESLDRPELHVTRTNHIAKITIDRGARRNALSVSVMHHLISTMDELDNDSEVRVIVIRGAGDVAFSAGRDLKELAELDASPSGPHQPMRGLARNVFEAVYDCATPVIAAINGWAVGGGLELALAADIRLAAAHARFALPESKRGLGANFGATLLPRVIAPGIAIEMLFLGDDISAERALEIGLVHQVYERANFDQAVDKYALEVASRAPLTLRRYKAMMRRSLDLPVSAALRLNLVPNPYVSADRIEGIRAFNEGRAPRWTGM